MDLLSGLAQDFGQFFASDPSVLGFQFLMLSLGAIVVFLVLWTARDIMLRSDSFIVQLLCIVLSAALPGLGFLLYLLLRPAATVRQRRMERDIAEMLSKMQKHGKQEQGKQVESEKAKK